MFQQLIFRGVSAQALFRLKTWELELLTSKDISVKVTARKNTWKIDGLPLKGGHQGGGGGFGKKTSSKHGYFTVFYAPGGSGMLVKHIFVHLGSRHRQKSKRLSMIFTKLAWASKQHKTKNAIYRPAALSRCSEFHFFLFFDACAGFGTFNSYPHHWAQYWECSEKGSEQEGTRSSVLLRFSIVL